MAELHWFPFFPSDWLASPAVGMMLPEQRGAYIQLLAYAWGDGSAEPSLPDDPATLAHLSGLGRRWAKLGAVVRGQFEIRDGRLYNAKLSGVADEQQKKHEQAVVRGQNSAKARADKRQTVSKQSTSHLQQSELESEGEEATASPQRPAAVRRTIKPVPPGPAFSLGPYLEAHAARFPGGMPPAALLGKVLKALEAKHGPAETLTRWRTFLAAKGEFGVHKFAETWSEWGSVPPNGARPRVLAATEQVIE